jgi:hypothetical protein
VGYLSGSHPFAFTPERRLSALLKEIEKEAGQQGAEPMSVAFDSLVDGEARFSSSAPSPKPDASPYRCRWAYRVSDARLVSMTCHGESELGDTRSLVLWDYAAGEVPTP